MLIGVYLQIFTYTHMHICIQKAVLAHFCTKLCTNHSKQQVGLTTKDIQNLQRGLWKGCSVQSSCCKLTATTKHFVQLKTIAISCVYQGQTNVTPFPSGYGKLGCLQRTALSPTHMKKSINIRLSLLELTPICFLDF